MEKNLKEATEEDFLKAEGWICTNKWFWHKTILAPIYAKLKYDKSDRTLYIEADVDHDFTSGIASLEIARNISTKEVIKFSKILNLFQEGKSELITINQ